MKNEAFGSILDEISLLGSGTYSSCASPTSWPQVCFSVVRALGCNCRTAMARRSLIWNSWSWSYSSELHHLPSVLAELVTGLELKLDCSGDRAHLNLGKPRECSVHPCAAALLPTSSSRGLEFVSPESTSVIITGLSLLFPSFHRLISSSSFCLSLSIQDNQHWLLPLCFHTGSCLRHHLALAEFSWILFSVEFDCSTKSPISV